MKYVCWALTGVALVSMAAWGFFDFQWVAPVGKNEARGLVIVYFHLAALVAGPLYSVLKKGFA